MRQCTNTKCQVSYAENLRASVKCLLSDELPDRFKGTNQCVAHHIKPMLYAVPKQVIKRPAIDSRKIRLLSSFPLHPTMQLSRAKCCRIETVRVFRPPLPALR